jgi:FKBP-type peptidyl-prolyl cis-trans isomerase 2
MENDLPDLEAIAVEAHRLHTAGFGFGEIAEAINTKFDTKYTGGNMALMIQSRDTEGQKRPYKKREPKEKKAKEEGIMLTLRSKDTALEYKAVVSSVEGEQITLDVQGVGVLILSLSQVLGITVGT